MSDPRNNADDAYEAFTSMDQRQWLGLVASLIGGGTLMPEEQKGFDRAVQARKAAK